MWGLVRFGHSVTKRNQHVTRNDIAARLRYNLRMIIRGLGAGCWHAYAGSKLGRNPGLARLHVGCPSRRLISVLNRTITAQKRPSRNSVRSPAVQVFYWRAALRSFSGKVGRKQFFGALTCLRLCVSSISLLPLSRRRASLLFVWPCECALPHAPKSTARQGRTIPEACLQWPSGQRRFARASSCGQFRRYLVFRASWRAAEDQVLAFHHLNSFPTRSTVHGDRPDPRRWESGLTPQSADFFRHAKFTLEVEPRIKPLWSQETISEDFWCKVVHNG